MKIIIINGSPRGNGLTASILHEIEKNLVKRNVGVAYYNLAELSMAQCRGCCSCFTTGSCHMKDDAEKLSELIADADGLVLGSPTYASNVSGYMKVLIDRGHFVIEQLLAGKKCITVTTGENYGSRDASKVLERLVLYSGGSLVSKIIVNAPFMRGPVGSTKSLGDSFSEIGLSPKLFRTCDRAVTRAAARAVTLTAARAVTRPAARAAARLYDAISRDSRNLFQAMFHKLVFCCGIKPFVKRKGAEYAGVVEKWQLLGIKA